MPRTININRNVLFFLVLLGLVAIAGCKSPAIPKPYGYFRIDFPEKNYRLFDTGCPYSFEYPGYVEMEKYTRDLSIDCWYNLNFKDYNAKVYLTYHALKNNLGKHTEDCYRLVSKHAIKADDIPTKEYHNNEHKVHGMVYDIKGNTATPLVFFATDSLNHFLYGSLYFNTAPNKDSLAPAINYFREDVLHLMETLKWQNN